MDFNNPNFVSFMQTNYNTVRVSFLSRAPHIPAPYAPAPRPVSTSPAWAKDDRPWVTAEDLEPPVPSVTLYSYKVPKDLKLEVGDIVIVPTNDSISIARVEVVDEFPSLDFTKETHFKWVIQRVNFDVYNELVAKEAEFNRRMVDVKRMQAQQEMVRTMRAQFLSENDPETARLFSEALQSIGAQVPAAPVSPKE